MFSFEYGRKVLYVEFSDIYPIAGFCLEYKNDKWEFDPFTMNVAVQIGNIIVDDKGNILMPESFTHEVLQQVISQDATCVEGNITNENYVDKSDIRKVWEPDVNSIIRLYNSIMPNRFVVDKTNLSIDRDTVANYACNSVSIVDNTIVAIFFQDWIAEKTCVIWSFNPKFKNKPKEYDDQKDMLISAMKHILFEFQYRIAMPSKEINELENKTEEMTIGIDKFNSKMIRLYPRPWIVVAWCPKEKRTTTKYLSIYREIMEALYKKPKSSIPHPLRRLLLYKYDLSSYISNWDIDTSTTENTTKTVLAEFYNRVTIDENEKRKTPPQVLESKKAHPYDAANTVCEILRQIDKVFGVNWAGGGVPCKSVVINKDIEIRSGIKTYVLEKDDFTLTEIGMDYGKYNKYENKIEYLLIPQNL